MSEGIVRGLINKILNHIPMEDTYADGYVSLSNIRNILRCAAKGIYDRELHEKELSNEEVAIAKELARENDWSLATDWRD
ncbi:MAG TPA: hypothetical protein ACFYEM_09530 [Candidatus Hypogeohydataceae bacterium YC40]